MKAVTLMQEQGLSLRKSARYTGASNKRLYAVKKPRVIGIDKEISKLVQQVASNRPTYGTRRMATTMSRITGKPVNRKKIKKIYHYLGWNTPAKPKKEIIRSRKRPKPTRPDQLWQADMTYIWCGQDRWCYLFNVLDAFTREWVGYAFEPRAVTDGAIAALTEALASKKPDCSNLTLRTDNGSQYVSLQFGKAVKAYGVRQEFIHYHTPEQNGHVESFHKSLKKEYVWPRDFETFQDAEAAISYAFEDYNQNRVHCNRIRDAIRIWHRTEGNDKMSPLILSFLMQKTFSFYRGPHQATRLKYVKIYHILGSNTHATSKL